MKKPDVTVRDRRGNTPLQYAAGFGTVEAMNKAWGLVYWGQLVGSWDELPPRARELLRGIPIVVADLPAEADVDTGVDPRSLGLFSGTPHGDYPHLGGQPGLTQILLFRRNIERVAATDEDLREEIRITLLHETGHFFGLDDAGLEDIGLG